MAANKTDKFKKVGASTVTTLAAPGKAIGASSITVGSTTNYPTDTGIVIAIRKVDSDGKLIAGTLTEWEAVVTSGTTLDIGTVPVLGDDQVYPAGSSTQVYISTSAYAQSKLVEGILVHADQDGTLKAGAVDVAAVLADDVVTDDKILVDPRTTRFEMLGDFLASGCVWGTSANLNGSMSAGVAYINGRRLTISAVVNRAFTATKDTYVDIKDNLDNTYTLVYTEVANLAAEPVLAANSMRLALVRTTGAAISVVLTGRVKLGVSDPSGAYVMSPVNKLSYETSKASARKDGQAIPNASSTLLQIGTEICDYGNNYDTTNYRYVAPFSGWCDISGWSHLVASGATNSYKIVGIRVNGSGKEDIIAQDSGQNIYVKQSWSRRLYVHKGDYIDFTSYIDGGSGGSINMIVDFVMAGQ